jgi:hypothetical protein
MSDALSQPSYRSVSVSARPPRLAVAIPGGDEWRREAIHVIEALSEVWGGAGDAIFVANGDAPPPVWRALERFDADVFGYYVDTFATWQQDEPDAFKRWVEEAARHYVAQGSTNTVDDWREELTKEEWTRRPRRDWKPDAAVEERIRTTMSPFYLGDTIFDTFVGLDGFPGYRFVDVLRLEPVSPEPLIVVDGSEYGEDVELLMAARTGLATTAHREALTALGVKTQTVAIPTPSLSRALEYAWTGETGRQLGGSWLQGQTGSGHRATPFGHSVATCSWFGREGWPPPPFLFIVGDTAEDFALAFLLSRITQTAAWLPSRLLEGNRAKATVQALTSTISNLTQHPSGERAVRFSSASLSLLEIQEVRDSVVASIFFPDLAEHISVVDPNLLSPDVHWRLWDEQVNQRTDSEAFMSGVQTGPIATPLATVSTPDRGSEVGWIVDADVIGHRVPTRAVLADLVVETAPIGNLLRPARDGVSYFCFRGFIENALSLHLNLLRPRLALPSAEAIFAALLARAGLQGRSSAAGGFARHAEQLWGSLDALAESLSNLAQSRVLAAYLSEADSEVEPGVRLDVVGRRFLSFDNFMSVSEQSVEPTRQLVDDWLGRKILRRGLVLGCEQCRYSGWYDIDDVGAAFTCQRCRERNPLVVQAWKQPASEPNWYYDLAEPIYQALRGNIHAPVFCLRTLKKDSTSFLFTHERDVHDSKTGSLVGELDIWAIRDGRIIVGEATTTDDFGGQLSKKLSTLRRIADAVTADDVVLSTTAPEWQPNVVKQGTERLGVGRASVQFLTASDMGA